LIKSGYSGIVIAELTAECGMAAECRSDIRFDDIWNFLHVSSPAFRP